MSPYMASSLAASEGFPRVSGDEPQPGVFSDALAAFSPRERG